MNFLSLCIHVEPNLKNVSCVLRSFTVKRYIHEKKTKNYSKYYKILELPDDADQDLVRRAFINLCKKYHPDSQNMSADSAKFQEIENAYSTLQNKFAEERWNHDEGVGEYGLYYDEDKKRTENTEEVKIFDIKHNAPQHRQYLSFGGVGSGTPAQRQKQYENYQRTIAIQNVYSHQIKKLSDESLRAEQTLAIKDKREAKKIKTRYGMERLVEDLIQESMAKGEFDNLKNAGKPLPQSNYNPYLDFVTHKMNQVMIDNGFIPEWITLQKEISDYANEIRNTLSDERRKLGKLPLNSIEKNNWENFLNKLVQNVKVLNKKIDKFNLVVPILDKQMLHFNLDEESDKVLKNELGLENYEKEGGSDEKTTVGDDLHSFMSIFIGNR